MKQNIFIAALLAGMLALAGCGGGSSSNQTDTNTDMMDTDTDDTTMMDDTDTEKTPAEMFSEAIAACETAECVDGEITKAEAKDSGVSASELRTLEGEADKKKTALADTAEDQPLSGLSRAAAEELADGLEGGEALRPGSQHINTVNAILRDNEDWGDPTTSTLGGWQGESYHIANPEGSSGREQDVRIYTENEVFLRQLYREFFSTGQRGITDGNITGTGIADVATTGVVRGEQGVVVLDDVTSDDFDRETVPSNFFTSGFTFNEDFDHDDTPGDPAGRWELRGDFYDVPGIFVCPATGRCAQQMSDETDDNNDNPTLEVVTVDHGDFDDPSITLEGATSAVTGIFFVPSNFSTDETHVNADWAEVQNPDFMNFGVYWNSEINNDGEVINISVDPFAGGGVLYEETADIVLSGQGDLTATYTGKATGVYVRTATNENDDREATGYGEFGADARFTAVFGESLDEDTLSGTIRNFETLSKCDDCTGANSAWELEFSGDIVGGVVTEDDFHARFQGAPATNPVRQSNGHGFAPYGLVGTFESSDQLPNGHVTGAFGTECDGNNCVHN